MKITPIARLFFVFIPLFFVGCASAVAPTPSPVPPTAVPTETAVSQILLVSGDWAPYVYETPDDHSPIVAIVIAAFQEVGMTPKIAYYPWKRAEDITLQGTAFAAFPYAFTPERAKDFDFSDPLYISQSRIFYNTQIHPDGIPFETLEDLRGYTVGGLLGGWYEPIFAEVGLKTEYTDSIQANIDKLALGRIDVFVEEANAGWFTIRELYPDKVDQFATVAKPVEAPGFESDLRLLVSRTYPHSAELLAQFNTGLAAIRANGKYKEILEQYQIATDGQ